MQRTLNYTNRRRIEKSEAVFSIFDNGSDVPEFSVVFSLNKADYTDDPSLYVEAHYKETRQRYDFGKLSRITPPSNRKLEQLDLSGSILFRVLVVDESGKHGLLLASGEGFRSDSANNDDDSKSSILTVKTRPLGQLTWKVEFETGGMPELYLNNGIPNAIEKMRTDPLFQALILPAALKQVLSIYAWNGDDDSDGYHRWMAFANMFTDRNLEGDDPNDIIAWVDDVVEEFSSRFYLCDRLVNAIRGKEEDQ